MRCFSTDGVHKKCVLFKLDLLYRLPKTQLVMSFKKIYIGLRRYVLHLKYDHRIIVA